MPTQNFDDLAHLAIAIDELLAQRDRGDDITATYTKIQQQVKGLAVEFGHVGEILDRQQQMLASQGLKIQLVARESLLRL